MEKNIVLIGFMGSGKSMVARALARHLDVDLVSTDAVIEAKEGVSIHAIFQTKGEPYFRKVESATVQEIAQRSGVIIDCGGGVVLCHENLTHLKRNGVVFYLEADPHTIYQRIKNETHRPLLQVPNPLGCIQELYHQRLPLYHQADHIIDANGASIDGPVRDILSRI